MNPIQILPDVVVDQIAAGEIIERPASVVKELVENAIDAGADLITVEVKDGGRTFLRVTDNGCGMDRVNLEKSLQRFATSKIKSAQDLDCISSYGFRGEALPSIASVSHLTLLSKSPSQQEAYQLRSSGGKIQGVESSVFEKGTQVTVENLFFNLPARLKFLKTDSTENKRVLTWIQAFSLAHPSITFRFIQDGRISWENTARAKLADRLFEIYGDEFMQSSCLLNWHFEHGTVQGLITEPSNTRRDRTGIRTFINKRLVQNATLNFIISKFYKDKIPGGFFPTVVLLLEVEPSLVDVNVHPAKLEVRFRNEGEIITACLKAFTAALSKKVSLSMPGTLESFPLAAVNVPLNKEDLLTDVYGQHPVSHGEIKQAAGPDILSSGKLPLHGDFVSQKEPLREIPLDKTEPILIGQIKNRYLILQMADAMAVLDQHAAHERVLYEKLLKSRETGPVAAQYLLVPQVLSFAPEDAEILEENRDQLNQLGFSIELFGKNTFKVDAMPSELNEKKLQDYFLGLSAYLRDSSSAEPAMEKLVRGVCRQSVMFGDSLSSTEQEKLVNELFQCENPYSCPHGRPVFFKL
ncbi:MAG: DNA mismatch repair endonuclease MutL, partial [Candidatus Aureabacteria bacterium]|nr:DNA mismatch repair endonuclease MutL [Candidatus Auribacterota bacterium]